MGFPGDREKGRKEVYETAQRGRFFKTEGEFMYHSIGYFMEGEKSSGFRAFQRLYEKYPSNHAFGLMIAYHYRRSGYLEKCIEICEKNPG